MRVTVTGATGLIGRAVCLRLIERGHDVTALGRDAARVAAAVPGARALAWEPTAGAPPAEALVGSAAVIHLAGEPVADRRWSAQQKARIRESRIVGTRNLVDALRELPKPPEVLLAGSAIGYFGDRDDEVLDESSDPGDDFLARLCRDWEREADRATELGVRVANLRTGIVLARDGGALPRLALPFRFFVGGRLGSGRQWMSWIHLDDEVGLILHALTDPAMTGPLVLAAPSPARNRVMAAAIGRILGRPALLPAPRAALALVLGERVEVLLASQRVAPRRALAAGYRFAFPDLEPALRDLLPG